MWNHPATDNVACGPSARYLPFQIEVITQKCTGHSRLAHGKTRSAFIFHTMHSSVHVQRLPDTVPGSWMDSVAPDTVLSACLVSPLFTTPSTRSLQKFTDTFCPPDFVLPPHTPVLRSTSAGRTRATQEWILRSTRRTAAQSSPGP